MVKLFDICNVPINKILHDDKLSYVKEGHGGKHVSYWPVYRFFQLYYTGEKENAKLAFAEWYIDQYTKYSETSKFQGGMKGGSLDRLVKGSADISSNEGLLKNAVLSRVQQRFQLLESISSSGYIPDHNFPVAAIKFNENQYKLVSGHHRTAILASMGYDSVPGVFVFNSEVVLLFYLMRQKLIRIIHKHDN